MRAGPGRANIGMRPWGVAAPQRSDTKAAMAPSRTGQSLIGRDSECQALQNLLATVRAGQSQVLVLRGEAGVGKSALLGHLSASAPDFLVLRTTGIESDMELAYAGVQQLCAPVLDHRTALPQPQRDALESAFGLRSTGAPDRFLVGLAVLGLLAAASQARPVLCVVDDVQWLDHVSAHTLFFVARRLLAEPIAVTFALREPVDGAAGLPELPIGGLSAADAHTLLQSTFPGRLDRTVCDRIIAETNGNPLALLEIPDNLTPAELAVGFRTSGRQPVARDIEEQYLRILRALPADTQMVLLLAAAEPVGDTALLTRAMVHLGLKPAALAPARAAGLIDVGTWVQFRHPLVRSAVYHTAGIDQRCTAHAALAATIDPAVDRDRRAWHRALAADGPDEEVAGELVRSAGRARERGGTAAAAAFLTRAVELTPEAGLRGARALDAAEAYRETASFAAARQLLAVAEIAPLNPIQQARLSQLRTRLSFVTARSGGDPGQLSACLTQFATTAGQFEDLDAALAGDAYLEALSAAMYVGRLGDLRATRDVATAARAACARALGKCSGPVPHLAYALASLVESGPAAAMPAVCEAIDVVRSAAADQSPVAAVWLWRAFPIVHESLSSEAWDDTSWSEIADHAIRIATETGALALLPSALLSRAGAHLDTGEFAAAASLIARADDIGAATGYAPVRYHKLCLAAWRGDEAETTHLIAEALREGSARGEGRLAGLACYAAAVLNNGLGRYQAALHAARTAFDYEDLGIFCRVLIELVEAAARAGDTGTAADALDRLRDRTLASGTHWALGALACSGALLAPDEEAEALYQDAIGHLEQTRRVLHLARARLLYGEWLRRHQRPTEAREPLRTAHLTFRRIGADAFAERARRELLAAGERTRKPAAGGGGALSAQETQIAQLAGAGLTNPEIAAQLFLSAHTVEWHLRKVFAKLQIRSRRQLRNTALVEGDES